MNIQNTNYNNSYLKNKYKNNKTISQTNIEEFRKNEKDLTIFQIKDLFDSAESSEDKDYYRTLLINFNS